MFINYADRYDDILGIYRQFNNHNKRVNNLNLTLLNRHVKHLQLETNRSFVNLFLLLTR